MMKRTLMVLTLSIAVLFGCGVSAFAQQTGFSGVVTDSTGGAIPGAKVEAKQTGGTSFFATANGKGVYVIPSVTAAEYTITASAPGFATVQKTLLLLVGQLATVDMALPVQSANTSVIVEATNDTAIDTTSSSVSGNVTPQEVQDIPVNGRNYVELSALVPGIKSNSFGNTPAASGQSTNAGDAETGKFQITLDGLQVSQDSVGSSFGQPKFSQDAISQFQIITNRFDAVSGRSAGIYVNVQTKTGTNTMHGGAFLYARNSYFNAADPIVKFQVNHLGSTANPVLNFADQQYGGTLGGAIRKDKLWYFASYEGEHRPNHRHHQSLHHGPRPAASLLTPPSSSSTSTSAGSTTSATPRTTSSCVATASSQKTDFVAGADPSQSYSSAVSSSGFVFDWNRTINDHLINDAHAGFHYFQFSEPPLLPHRLHSDHASQCYRRAALQRARNLRPVHPAVPRRPLLAEGQAQRQGRRRVPLHPARRPVPAVPDRRSHLHRRHRLARALQPVFPHRHAGPRALELRAHQRELPQHLLHPGLRRVQHQHQPQCHRALGAGRLEDPAQAHPQPRSALRQRPGRLQHQLRPHARPADGPTPTPTPTSPRASASPTTPAATASTVHPRRRRPLLRRPGRQPDHRRSSSTPARPAPCRRPPPGPSAGPISLPTPFAGQNPSANPSGYVNTPQPVAQGSRTPYSLQASIGIARELPYKTTITADFVHNRVYDDYILLQANLLVNPANPDAQPDPDHRDQRRQLRYARLRQRRHRPRHRHYACHRRRLHGGNPNASPRASTICNNLFGTSPPVHFTTYNGAGVMSRRPAGPASSTP